MRNPCKRTPLQLTPADASEIGKRTRRVRPEGVGAWAGGGAPAVHC